MVKPYFEKYEDHIDDGINKVTNDAQAVAMQNFQGFAWHLFMKTDRIVLDLFAQIVKYILNFDPGTNSKTKQNISVKKIRSEDNDDIGEVIAMDEGTPTVANIQTSDTEQKGSNTGDSDSDNGDRRKSVTL